MYVCLYDKRALRHLLIFLSNKKQKRKIKQNKKTHNEERLVLQKKTLSDTRASKICDVMCSFFLPEFHQIAKHYCGENETI